MTSQSKLITDGAAMDETTEKKPKEFVDLPVDVIQNIIMKVDPHDRFSVRKVNRNLRQLIDEMNPGFRTISVDISTRNEVFVRYINGRCGCGTSVVHYKQMGNDCVILYEDDQGHEPSQSTTSLLIDYHSNKGSYEKGSMRGKSIEPCSGHAQIIPSFKAGNLEELHLNTSDKPTAQDVEKICNSDQWKHAKEFDGNCDFTDVPIKHLSHFSRVRAPYEKISVDTAVEIRNVLLSSGNIERAMFLSKSDFGVDVVRVFDPEAANVNKNTIFHDGAGVFIQVPADVDRNTDYNGFLFSNDKDTIKFEKKI